MDILQPLPGYLQFFYGHMQFFYGHIALFLCLNDLIRLRTTRLFYFLNNITTYNNI